MIRRYSPIKRRSPVRKPGYEDPAYCAWIGSQPCYVCARTGQKQRSRTEVAHVGIRGLSQRCPDRETIPLCTWHHQDSLIPGGGPESHHSLGASFRHFHGICRVEAFEELREAYHNETGKVA